MYRRAPSTRVIRNRDALGGTPARETALDCIEAGIAAAHPERVTREAVSLADETLRVGESTYDLSSFDRVVALGGGNAASQVALELERILGDRLDGGVVVTDDPVEGGTSRVEVLPGDHPVPSERGVEGATRLLSLAREADARTLVLGVVTGGGSALLPAPASGLSLADLRGTTEALLESGATIHEVNAVRKHCSALKGGGLARAAAPAAVACLVLSDVVGNDLDVVASGPFVPDSSTFEDALDVLDRYGVDVPRTVRARLERGAAGDLPETPKPGDSAFERVSTHVLADGYAAVAAARDAARDAGYAAMVLSTRVRGEAREAAKTHVAVAEEALATGNPVEPPAVVVSGGETTVTVRGDGEGGPNQEFALSAAAELRDEGVVVAAVDTDGVDGSTDAAGAIVDAATADERAARDALGRNDARPALAAAGALVETGPTGTNVNDLRVVVVDPPAE